MGRSPRPATTDAEMPGFVPENRNYAVAFLARRRAASEEWERVDLNHRRLSRQIYSLIPLTNSGTLPWSARYVEYTFAPAGVKGILEDLLLSG